MKRDYRLDPPGGTKDREARCPSCGAAINDDESQCSTCGEPRRPKMADRLETK